MNRILGYSWPNLGRKKTNTPISLTVVEINCYLMGTEYRLTQKGNLGRRIEGPRNARNALQAGRKSPSFLFPRMVSDHYIPASATMSGSEGCTKMVHDIAKHVWDFSPEISVPRRGRHRSV